MPKNYHCCATCIHFKIERADGTRRVTAKCLRLGYETKSNYQFECWDPRLDIVNRIRNQGGIKLLSFRQDEVVENYHGTLVKDPFRWLEDPSNPETKAFVAEQNQRTQEYIRHILDRDAIHARLQELCNFEKFFVPKKSGGRYYFLMNSGLENQPRLYVQDGLKGTPKVVLNPNAWSTDGTVALTGLSFSPDGKWLAYASSKSGSDWQIIRLLNLETGTDALDVIQWCKFTNAAWLKDSSGFYYGRYPEPGTVLAEDQNNFHKVYFHALGTTQVHDQLVFERPGFKELSFHPSVTDDGKYLTLHVSHGTDSHNRFYYRSLDGQSDFVRLLDDSDASYGFIYNDGTQFYFHTTQDAPRGRIVAVDTLQPERSNWREVVAEDEAVISHVEWVNDHFVVVYMKDAHHLIKLFDKSGQHVKDIALPAVGSISELYGKANDTEFFFSFTSYLYPTSVYRYDFQSGEVTLVWGPTLPYHPDEFETYQVFYPSKDGTKVSMFLTHRRGMEKNGENPTLLYGYGGFNLSQTPVFKFEIIQWLEQGGVYAVANLRGGSEYGEAWHRAGMLENKQNVFDDFITAGEYLIDAGYTRASRLAISGRSNGGLLTSACMVQRPDLFGAVSCNVPVTDMLRYHKFTVGRYWVPEYGNAEENPEHFRFMYAYSPLHNIKPGVDYPPILITTADTDDRVVPMHAEKLAATLQTVAGHKNPVLLRVETNAGHGAGKPISKVIDEFADMHAFLLRELGVLKQTTEA